MHHAPLIATGTSPTPTAHTLHSSTTFPLSITSLQPRFRHPTDTSGTEIRLLSLHAPQTTQLLIPLLLPFGYQHRIRVPILQQPLVQFLRNRAACVVQVVDVAAAGVGDLEDGPEDLVSFLAVVTGVFCVFHFVAVAEKGVFDVVEARWWGFARARGADGWHGGWIWNSAGL